MMTDLPEEFWEETDRVQQGIYQMRWSMRNHRDMCVLLADEDNGRWYPLSLWTYAISLPLPELQFDDEGVLVSQECYPSYGICDHWSQVLVKFPQIIDSVIPYLVRVYEVRADEQYPLGPYIGAFKEAASHEYLYDSGLERVYVYEVHQLKM